MGEVSFALPPRPKAPWYVPTTVRGHKCWMVVFLITALLIWTLAIRMAVDGSWFFAAVDGLSALTIMVSFHQNRLLIPTIRSLEAHWRLLDAMALAGPLVTQILNDIEPPGFDAWLAEQEARNVRPTRH